MKLWHSSCNHQHINSITTGMHHHHATITNSQAILGDNGDNSDTPSTENTPGDNPRPNSGSWSYNRPTTWGLDHNRNPNRPTGWGIIWKLALTHIPDPKTNWYTTVGRGVTSGSIFGRGGVSPEGVVSMGFISGYPLEQCVNSVMTRQLSRKAIELNWTELNWVVQFSSVQFSSVSRYAFGLTINLNMSYANFTSLFVST